jgi:hypothetical protein
MRKTAIQMGVLIIICTSKGEIFHVLPFSNAQFKELKPAHYEAHLTKDIS